MLKIDCHTHSMQGNPSLLAERAFSSGVERCNLLGVPGICGAGNNFDCMKSKYLHPGRAYAFGGLVWEGRHCPQPREQLRLMMQAGFDGLKLIESKPTLQKSMQFHPQDEHFSGMFAMLEQEGFPLLWHVGDPAAFWSLGTAPAFAVENGWTYEGEGFLSLAELYRETETVLERHPGLHVILAHFYFCSDDAAHLERLFSRFPNLRVDITPGVEMYHHFLGDRGFWQEFFEKHASRILMGSDMTDDTGDDTYLNIGRIIRGTLLPHSFEEWDLRGQGFALSETALDAIWGANFLALCGFEPSTPDKAGVEALLRFYENHLPNADYAAALAAYRRMTS